MKINGSLVFDASSASEIQNLRVQKMVGTAVPAYGAASAGRLVFVTEAGSGYLANTIYYGNPGTNSWVALATGGNAAALQSEVDTTQASLGDFILGDGSFDPAPLNALNNVSGLTSGDSLLDALAQLDASISGKDTLDEILAPTVGHVIYGGAGPTWATALPGATSGVQPYDAFLTSIAGLGTASDRIIYTTGVDTAAETVLSSFGRTLIDDTDSSAARTTLGVVIGTDVQAYDPDLAALAALTPTDDYFVVSTATGYELQSPAQVAATLNQEIGVDVQAYDADLTQIAGFNAAVIDGGFLVGTGGAEGARFAIEAGATARTSLGLGDIATEDQDSFVKTDGSSAFTADLTLSGFKITSLAPGVSGTDAINLNQLQAAVTGLSWKQAVRAATTANVANLATATTADGVTLVSGDRVLVRAQTASAENGIYTFNGTGLVRADDMNAPAEFASATVFVAEGGTYADTGWTQTAEVVTVGTSSVAFAQFTGSGTYTAGTGLALSGNTFNVNLGSGIFEQGSDAVGIELYNPTTGAIILTTDGSTRDTSDATKLHLKVNTSQLDQDATNGLFIKAGGITATELAAAVAGSGLVGGGGVELSVNVDGASLEINADVVRVKAAGVTNAMLSTGGTINLKSNSGAQTEPMVLGEDLNFEVTSGTGVAVAVSAGNIVTMSGVDATTTTKGVASFAAADFSVTGGAVSLVAKGVNSLDDVTVSSATTGQVLVKTAGDFTNQDIFAVYDGVTDVGATAKTSHVFTHNIGQKYVNVTVVDDTDEVVIPQSITFNTTSQLTVTFNTAIKCRIIAMGVTGGKVVTITS